MNSTKFIISTFLICIVFIFGIIIFNDYSEVSNNITLIVEIWIGIILTIVVYHTSSKHERDTADKIIEEVQSTVRNYNISKNLPWYDELLEELRRKRYKTNPVTEEDVIIEAMSRIVLMEKGIWKIKHFISEYKIFRHQEDSDKLEEGRRIISSIIRIEITNIGNEIFSLLPEIYKYFNYKITTCFIELVSLTSTIPSHENTFDEHEINDSIANIRKIRDKITEEFKIYLQSNEHDK